jgi:ATP-dependent metalloprotease
MSNQERIIHIFKSQPLLHNNSMALSHYVKALVSLDKLDDSPLLKKVVVSTTNSV